MRIHILCVFVFVFNLFKVYSTRSRVAYQKTVNIIVYFTFYGFAVAYIEIESHLWLGIGSSYKLKNNFKI